MVGVVVVVVSAVVVLVVVAVVVVVAGHKERNSVVLGREMDGKKGERALAQPAPGAQPMKNRDKTLTTRTAT